ncbi:MAG: hypothetical protein JXR07_00545 [Reichenbachiella sp.]
MKKQIILARPNLFIVNEMKKLMNDCRFDPFRLTKKSELDTLNSENVSGFVISTSLHSPIEMGYIEMIEKLMDKHPDKPILLASMISAENTKKSINLNFEKNNLDCEVLSISDSNEGKNLDKKRQLLIIEKSDITNDDLYPTTKATVERFFG